MTYFKISSLKMPCAFFTCTYLPLQNNKPLMEKRRRQRINDSLVQLKSLVLQAMNKDVSL